MAVARARFWARNLLRPSPNGTRFAPVSSAKLRMSGRQNLRRCTQSVMHRGLGCMRPSTEQTP